MYLFKGYASYYKEVFTFFLHNISMSRKNINFDDKNINKSNVYKSEKAIKASDMDVTKILISKSKGFNKKAHLNTLLDITIMVTREHYV